MLSLNVLFINGTNGLIEFHPPPVARQTNTCENIPSQTSFAGGNKCDETPQFFTKSKCSPTVL